METSELPVELRPLGGSTLGSDPGPSEAPQHSTLVVHARIPGPLFPFVSGTLFFLLHVPPRHSQRSIFATYLHLEAILRRTFTKHQESHAGSLPSNVLIETVQSHYLTID